MKKIYQGLYFDVEFREGIYIIRSTINRRKQVILSTDQEATDLLVAICTIFKHMFQ